jgi:Fe-S-cluster containining protein
MSSPNSTSHEVDAGAFGAWLEQFRACLQGRGGSQVPCGECVGCCVSSYSILVRPEDVRARSVIPAEFLTSVPALGEGVMAMGYLPDGTCPMLQSGRCTIYVDRPQTCRDYDCRVFAAAGIEVADKPVINQRVRAWRFKYENESARAMHEAVRRAAAFLREQGERFPEHRFPKNPSGVAVYATKCYEVFLNGNAPESDAAAVAAALAEANRRFDMASADAE